MLKPVQPKIPSISIKVCSILYINKKKSNKYSGTHLKTTLEIRLPQI